MGPRPRAECAATPRLPGCDRTATGYRGQDADEDSRDPSPAFAQLRDALTPPGGTTNLRFSYQDGHVAVRLNDASPAKKYEAARAVLQMPGVTASYHANDAQNDYVRLGTNPIPRAERRWFAPPRRHEGRAAAGAINIVGAVRAAQASRERIKPRPRYF
jgi:hypothetical protein